MNVTIFSVDLTWFESMPFFLDQIYINYWWILNEILKLDIIMAKVRLPKLFHLELQNWNLIVGYGQHTCID